MSATTALTATNTATNTATSTPTEARNRPLWRTGARAGILAAIATTAVAGAGMALDVPVEVGGEQIPLAGFAQVTLVCVAIGVLIAKALTRWTAQPRRNFAATTVALTALSLVPDLTADATMATRLVLMATHLVAAAIVIPTVARHLPARSR